MIENFMKLVANTCVCCNVVGSAGLGIGLKGKHSSKSGEPSGVFVKNVICGGAASQVC